MGHSSLMLLRALENALEGFSYGDCLHDDFFFHYYTSPALRTRFQAYQTNNRPMDIFLPCDSDDLTHIVQNRCHPRINVHAYCETEQALVQFRRPQQWQNRDSVFHSNRLHGQLARKSRHHLTYYMEHLEHLKEQGDADAADRLIVISQLLEDITVKINDEVRDNANRGVPPKDL